MGVMRGGGMGMGRRAEHTPPGRGASAGRAGVGTCMSRSRWGEGVAYGCNAGRWDGHGQARGAHSAWAGSERGAGGVAQAPAQPEETLGASVGAGGSAEMVDRL